MPGNHELEPSDILLTMSEDQLKSMLVTELTADTTDVELIKRINAALGAKEEKQIDCDVDKAWREFTQEHMGSEPLFPAEIPPETPIKGRRKRRPRFRVLIIAAVIAALILAGMCTASALGVDVWGAVASWTGDVFGFDLTPVESPVPSPDSLESYDDLHSALDAYGVAGKILPTYLPEGYVQTDFETADNATGGTLYIAMYENGTNTLVYQYISSASGGGEYMKDEGNPEVYTAGGVEHYIFTNVGQYEAVWRNEGFECCLSGFDSRDELLKVIDSIYGG
jgi:hypothetical protein